MCQSQRLSWQLTAETGPEPASQHLASDRRDRETRGDKRETRPWSQRHSIWHLTGETGRQEDKRKTGPWNRRHTFPFSIPQVRTPMLRCLGKTTDKPTNKQTNKPTKNNRQTNKQTYKNNTTNKPTNNTIQKETQKHKPAKLAGAAPEFRARTAQWLRMSGADLASRTSTAWGEPLEASNLSPRAPPYTQYPLSGNVGPLKKEVFTMETQVVQKIPWKRWVSGVGGMLDSICLTTILR